VPRRAAVPLGEREPAPAKLEPVGRMG
jgi:hypothetical protein